MEKNRQIFLDKTKSLLEIGEKSRGFGIGEVPDARFRAATVQLVHPLAADSGTPRSPPSGFTDPYIQK